MTKLGSNWRSEADSQKRVTPRLLTQIIEWDDDTTTKDKE